MSAITIDAFRTRVQASRKRISNLDDQELVKAGAQVGLGFGAIAATLLTAEIGIEILAELESQRPPDPIDELAAPGSIPMYQAADWRALARLARNVLEDPGSGSTLAELREALEKVGQ